MLSTIKHLVVRTRSKVREAAKRNRLVAAITGQKARGSHWSTVERNWIKTHSECPGCKTKKHLQVHHKLPYHNHPELEYADGTGKYSQAKNPDGTFVINLITMCMDKHECHLRIAHGGNFKAYNSNVVADAAEALANPKRRVEIEARAKVNRLYK